MKRDGFQCPSLLSVFSSSRRAGMRLFHSTIKNQKRLFLFSSVFKRILKTKRGSGGGITEVKPKQRALATREAHKIERRSGSTFVSRDGLDG